MRSKRALGFLVCGLAILVLAAGAVIKIGPRFIIGILRYDTRHEGALHVGDRAPDVALLALDGVTTERLAARMGRRPLVLVFGSFT